jgi:hypothetical protein
MIRDGLDVAAVAEDIHRPDSQLRGVHDPPSEEATKD